MLVGMSISRHVNAETRRGGDKAPGTPTALSIPFNA